MRPAPAWAPVRQAARVRTLAIAPVRAPALEVQELQALVPELVAPVLVRELQAGKLEPAVAEALDSASVCCPAA